MKRENKTVGPLFIDCNYGASHQLCGFARVAAFLSGQQKSGNGKISKVKSLDEKIKRYNNFLKFSAACEDDPLLDELEKQFGMSKVAFRKRVQTVENAINKWRGGNKTAFFSRFSKESWDKQKDTEKLAQSLIDCKACLLISANSIFPVPKNNIVRGLEELKKMPLHESNINNILEDIPKANRKSDVSAAAKHVFTTISKRFKELYQADFTDIIVKIPELGLAKRKTKKDFNNSYRKFAREIKRKTEEYWNKNDTENFLGNRVSYSVRKRIRHSLSFKTLEEANLRAQDRKRKEELGLRNQRGHAKIHLSFSLTKEVYLTQ